MKPKDLRTRRLALGMTQARLASTLGVAPLTVSRWELGTMGCARPGWLDVMMSLIERAYAPPVDTTTAGER